MTSQIIGIHSTMTWVSTLLQRQAKTGVGLTTGPARYREQPAELLHVDDLLLDRPT